MGLFVGILYIISILAGSHAGIFSSVNRTVLEQTAIDYEFSKDLSSVLTEATLASNCDGIVMIITKGCTDFIDYILMQLNRWAPPVLLVTYVSYDQIGKSELWATYLAWKRRPCSLIFVCDLMRLNDGLYESTIMDDDMFSGTEKYAPEENDIGYLKLPKFIASADQVLYISDFLDESPTFNNDSMAARREVQSKIVQQSGILLQILVENRTESEKEALMHIFSVCEYCGKSSKWQQRDLGYWQRNKTQFSKFFHVFDDFHKLSFNETSLNIGYFNHPPHFSCYKEKREPLSNNGSLAKLELETVCRGAEWEMISQMGKSIDFSVSWTNLSTAGPIDQGSFGATSNISNMILHFEEQKIDLGVGGISITPKRTMFVDFSNAFTNDPIVFVVEKKSDLFALGIWLAFNPEIWPLILLLIAIISLLFHVIISQITLERPQQPKKREGSRRWAFSAFLERQYMEQARKPIHVTIFEALQITLQPLLGQPLSTAQITQRPRRLLKLLLTIWWFSCLIISTLYNTSLITSLINPISPKEAESLQDLLDFGYSFKPAGKQGAFFELIKSTMDDLTNVHHDHPPEAADASPNDAELKTIKLIKRISERLVRDGSRPPTSTVAYVIEESAVKSVKWDQKEIGFSQIKVIRERLFLTTYAWPVQRNAPYKHKIDAALGRLNSAGLIEYWYAEYGHKAKERRGGKFRLRQKLSQINLNMQVLQGAFIFLILGHGFGAIILGVEHLTKRYNFRLFTKEEILELCRALFMKSKMVYLKYFASNHLELQRRLRRQRNRLRFRGVVRTIATFKQKDVPPFIK